MIGRDALALLGREIFRLAQQLLYRRAIFKSGACKRQTGNTKIEYLYNIAGLALMNKNIIGVEIEMIDTGIMSRFQRITELHENSARIGNRKVAFRAQLLAQQDA